MDIPHTKKRKADSAEKIFKRFDCVETQVGKPELGIKKGDKGTVMDIYDGPPQAYEVDVSNELDTFFAHELVLLSPENPEKATIQDRRAIFDATRHG